MLGSSIMRDQMYPPPRNVDLPPAFFGSSGVLLNDPYDHFYLNPSQMHFNVVTPRRQTSVGSSGNSYSDPSKFQVMLNVKHFRPDEIDVKTVDNYVVIHGKHEEQADEHGFVSREFTRRYQLPDDVEPEKVTSSLSKDGVLTIRAPRKILEPPPKNERIVPITMQRVAYLENAQKKAEQQQTSKEQK